MWIGWLVIIFWQSSEDSQFLGSLLTTCFSMIHFWPLLCTNMDWVQDYQNLRYIKKIICQQKEGVAKPSFYNSTVFLKFQKPCLTRYMPEYLSWQCVTLMDVRMTRFNPSCYKSSLFIMTQRSSLQKSLLVMFWIWQRIPIRQFSTWRSWRTTVKLGNEFLFFIPKNWNSSSWFTWGITELTPWSEHCNNQGNQLSQLNKQSFFESIEKKNWAVHW